jgi:hypothetical protein
MQGTIRLSAFSCALVALSLVAGDLERRPDVASLVQTLSSNRYLERLGALERLSALVRTTELSADIYPALKRAAADTTLSTDVRVTLTPLLETARYRWLTSDSRANAVPPSADQIAGWVSSLISGPDTQRSPGGPGGPNTISLPRDAAERELLDAICHKAAAPVVHRALEGALAREGLDDDAVARLRRLAEWTRPGLVVEYWQRRRNLAIQYFVVGVPSQAPGAIRPTRFDRVAQDFAVCASGNSLEPGEYPLGVAYPHPREQAAFFHLVSLPTARERLVYQYETQSLHANTRLPAITERTLGRAIKNKQPLDDAQLWLLGQLDQPTVARLLQTYFAEVPDAPFDLSQLAPMLSDVSSVHRTVCLMLALDGSYEVVPTLVEATKSKRFLPLLSDEPPAMGWVAALTIAAREPWDDVDGWLAGLLDRTDRISFGYGTQGDVGATAAAMLLTKHGEDPAQFGLAGRTPLERGLHDRFQAPVNADYRRRMFEDRMFKQLGVTPYYFADSTGRDAVQRWWRDRQPSAAPTPLIPTLPPPALTARAARP